jgi:RNA polymerase sigma-70 factor (ECF subfamily)
MSDISTVPEAGAPDIDALLERVQAGDRGAFVAVIRLYQQKVFVLAYSIVRDREDAQDVVQETFLRLYQKAGTYQPRQSFQGWLLQMAKNISIDHYRKHRKKRREWETATPIEEIQVAARPAGEGDSAASDLRAAFARGVESLAERQKLVFVMRHYNELQFSEISETLRISIGTAKSLHFKAVQNLRKRLAPVLGIEP